MERDNWWLSAYRLLGPNRLGPRTPCEFSRLLCCDVLCSVVFCCFALSALSSLAFRAVPERGAVSCCEPSLVYFQSGDVNAAQQLVIGSLLARDWPALVAVEAFVDTARGGGEGEEPL